MSRSKYLCLLIVLLLVQFCWSGQVSPFLQEYLQDFTTDADVEVLVMFSEQADIPALDQQLKREKATLAERNRRVIQALQEVATDTQPSMVAYFDDLKAEGLIEDYKTLWLVNMAIVKATPAGVYAIAESQDVDEVFLSYQIEGIKPVAESNVDQNVLTSVEVGLERINAPAAWAAGWTGRGRVVANMDTGVYGNHVALVDRFRGDVDGDGDCDESWFDPFSTNWPAPRDDQSHGTHTMGTICGRSEAGDTIGVAIDAQWIAAAAIDRGGDLQRTMSDALLSFQWFADPDGDPLTQDNPDAAGNSWGISPIYHGVDYCDETFWDVIDNLEAAGTAVVFSAGNEGPLDRSLRTPADRATTELNVFSVGSVDGNNPNLPIASSSSRGPSNCTPDGFDTIKPEVVAPGVNIRSSMPHGGYAFKSGTSMASPHITGAIGVIRGVNPDLDVDSIKTILMSTAHDLGDEGPDNSYGVGIIDLYEACLIASQGYGFVEGYVYDSSSQPLADAVVRIDGTDIEGAADDEGYYRIGAASETTYTVTAHSFGYLSQSADVEILSGQTVSQDFNLPDAGTGSVEGYVYDTNDNAIEGASVKVLDTPIDQIITDENGYFIIENIPSDATYALLASAIGHTSQMQDIYIIADTTVEIVFNLQPFESFETSNGGFYGDGIWECGSPQAGPDGAYDGERVWATDLDDEYPNRADFSMYSPMFLVNEDEAKIEFMHWYKMDLYYDGGNVLLSNDFGATWNVITPDIGYPCNDINALGDGPGFSGITPDWQNTSFTVSGFQGDTVMIKFRFASSNAGTDYGWYIDAFNFFGAEAIMPAMTVSETVYDVSLLEDSTESYTLTLGNIGNHPLDFMLDIPQDQFEPRPGGVILDSGGPDDFGYTFLDSDETGGPVYDWRDITEVGMEIIFNGDSNEGYSDTIALALPILFYGQSCDHIVVSTNGWFTFNSALNTYPDNQAIPNGGLPQSLVAVEWDDLDGGEDGECYYYFDDAENQFIVSWINWHYYPANSTPAHNFQVILDCNYNTITMQYGLVDGAYQSDVTIGIENANGDIGLQYAYDDADISAGLAITYYYPEYWLSAYPMRGVIEPGSSMDIEVKFDATELLSGQYSGAMNIVSNDHNYMPFTIPCDLFVGIVGVDETNISLPSEFALNQNYPNPFNPITEILFGLPSDGHVSLGVYDVMGRQVKLLLDESMAAGQHSVVWNGTNTAGEKVTSGIYFYKLTQGDNSLTRKMIMLK